MLLVALLSAISAAMAVQRYRSVPPDKLLGAKFVWFTAFGLASVITLYIIFAYDPYMCVLSSITVVSAAGTSYWLLLAKEQTSEAIAAICPTITT
jgi:hypothetical protein